MSPNNPLKLAFFAYAYNLSEVTRAIEIAKALRARRVEIRFFTHGGTHESLIPEAGFPLTTLKPLISLEKHEYLMDLDQGRRLGQPFSTSEWSAQVESELAVLLDFNPSAVYVGMNLPCAISARAAGLPLIYLLPTPGTQPYFKHNLAQFHGQYENTFTRLIPQRWKDRILNWIIPRLRVGTGPFNRAARHFGVPPMRATMNIIRGDLNLLSDLPELTGLPAESLPPDFHYVGPIFAHLPLPVPDEIHQVFSHPGINIFCAMGSSGPPGYLRAAALALRDSGHNVVIATTSILNPSELEPLPENVFATRYLPAPEVNSLADVAVIHGGQGTIQTACWAGTPVVGVGFQFEQNANLDMLVRTGMGVRIPLKEFSGDRVLGEIKNITSDPSYKVKAKRIQSLVRTSDGVANAAKAILDFIDT